MHKLQQVLEDAGIQTRSYSGRGMYGDTCLAATTDVGPGEIMAALVDAELTDDERNEVAQAVRSTRTDSMGRGIVYYWIDVPYEGDSEEDEEEEEAD
jgi:hypothetical protein